MDSDTSRYDHRTHAGNAGDVWKHLLLAEVAGHLLSRRNTLLYAESHVGYPKYSLEGRGEWLGGIGRCWSRLTALQNFCFFQIIGNINPFGLKRYLGSASLVLEIAGRYGADVDAEIWDIDPQVAAAWSGDFRVNFHLGDGFLGARALLDRSPPGMLLIDPPYTDEKDVKQACDLLHAASRAKWIVLWWEMMGSETMPEADFSVYSLNFSDIGLYCGHWQGATMAVAGADGVLAKRLDESQQRFRRIMYFEQRF
jgi:23S rRNA (adenine2030-N6)-methyltransferase